jgi:hypothetical protein
MAQKVLVQFVDDLDGTSSDHVAAGRRTGGRLKAREPRWRQGDPIW